MKRSLDPRTENAGAFARAFIALRHLAAVPLRCTLSGNPVRRGTVTFGGNPSVVIDLHSHARARRHRSAVFDTNRLPLVGSFTEGIKSTGVHLNFAVKLSKEVGPPQITSLIIRSPT